MGHGRVPRRRIAAPFPIVEARYHEYGRDRVQDQGCGQEACQTRQTVGAGDHGTEAGFTGMVSLAHRCEEDQQAAEELGALLEASAAPPAPVPELSVLRGFLDRDAPIAEVPGQHQQGRAAAPGLEREGLECHPRKPAATSRWR